MSPFQDRRDHEGPVQGRIPGDEEERALPGDRHPEVAVEELRVPDGRRVIPAHLLLQEVLRDEHHEAIAAGRPQHPPGKRHRVSPIDQTRAAELEPRMCSRPPGSDSR
jgi:hypothetical protein